jgi:alanine racemase
MYVRNSVDKLLQRFEDELITHNNIEISRTALIHNLNLFKDSSNHQIIPVLKANAYGHGIQHVAKALENQEVPYIAVDGYFEAVRIREVSKQPVLIMGAISQENYKNIKYDRFAFVVDSSESIIALGKTGKRIKVHLEINTGMNRYGCSPEKAVELARLISNYKNLELEGIMSHLADSDSVNAKSVEPAAQQFDACVKAILETVANPKLIHISQSAGSLKAESKYANTIRLGISLYGINPFSPRHSLHGKLSDLQPVLKLTSKITKIIELKKGDKVSYNYTFTAPKDMRIGVLPLGYHEGVNRALSNMGFVKIGDHFCPIVGRVCMNHTMISLDGIEANMGERVTVYSNEPGDRNSIDSVAKRYDLFNYSLLTSLSPDVRRTLVE